MERSQQVLSALQTFLTTPLAAQLAQHHHTNPPGQPLIEH